MIKMLSKNWKNKNITAKISGRGSEIPQM